MAKYLKAKLILKAHHQKAAHPDDSVVQFDHTKLTPDMMQLSNDDVEKRFIRLNIAAELLGMSTTQYVSTLVEADKLSGVKVSLDRHRWLVDRETIPYYLESQARTQRRCVLKILEEDFETVSAALTALTNKDADALTALAARGIGDFTLNFATSEAGSGGESKKDDLVEDLFV